MIKIACIGGGDIQKNTFKTTTAKMSNNEMPDNGSNLF